MENPTRPTLKHFSVANLVVAPKPEANFKMKPFAISACGQVSKRSVGFYNMSNVSLHVANACDEFQVNSDVDALKELCIICNHYDSKDKINWSNTLLYLKHRLSQLNYSGNFINDLERMMSSRLLSEPQSVPK